ncbi:hypothetical protein F53441_1728 [Fusarium austroafricanum]|uniref:Uncharacterized protein n=1 Tax=Fusarium austroafricanum TaxID=2364996 RepID=A0A8H4KRL3_9HYPO|nr:hypothetical protein F53441_1728 [Fusarium austroafricanum]
MGDSYSATSGHTATTAVKPPTIDTSMDAQKPQSPGADPTRLQTSDGNEKRMHSLEIPLDHVRSPPSPSISVNPALFRAQTSLDIDDYFTGPRNIQKHSKWPLILQMHGSIFPKLIIPLLAIGGWSTAITLIYKQVHDISVDSVLLTILGFVVGLSLSFRSSTAYERYAEGRRYWGMLTMASQTLGRVFWIHGKEVPDQDPRETILKKIGAMNLLVAFSVSLKHALRFEPHSAYPDMEHLIGHLNTFAKEATVTEQDAPTSRKKNFFKSVGEYLGVSFAQSNPRKALKKTDKPLGNLPLEILSHLAIIIDRMIEQGQLPVPMQQTIAYNHLTMMNDCMTGCDRVLNTPLPIAYTIAISQITFVYVFVLPFQLVEKLGYITIPASVVAAYIIFGLLFIGQEIENPFGHDVNDLPLDIYCDQIAADLDIIASHDKREPDSFLLSKKAMPLYPVSTASSNDWMKRSDEKLRQTIKDKPNMVFKFRKDIAAKKSEGTKFGTNDIKMNGDNNV